jgi:hypothetical protein
MNTIIQLLCIIWMNYKYLKKGHGGDLSPSPPPPFDRHCVIALRTPTVDLSITT